MLPRLGIWWVVGTALALPPVAGGGEPASPRLDAAGDPLPDGSLARIGSRRLDHAGGVTSVAFSPDGKVLATGHRDGRVRFWEPTTGKPLPGGVAEGEGVSALRFSPDGRLLASMTDRGGIALWDVSTGKRLHQMEKARDGNSLGAELQFSADGKVLVTLGLGKSVKLWDVSTSTETTPPALDGDGPVGLALSRTGPLALVTLERGVQLWDAAAGRMIREFSVLRHCVCVTFSPDGRTVATSCLGGEVHLWETATGRQRITLRQKSKEIESVVTLAFSPDGRLLLGPAANAVPVWDTWTGSRVHSFSGHEARITRMDLSADGKLLVTASPEDGTALVWDLERARKKLPPQHGRLETAEAEGCWKDLAGESPAKAYQAAAKMIAAPAETVPLLRDRLKPAAAAGGKVLERLVAELDDDDFEVRERAMTELKKLGSLAEGALRKSLTAPPSAEVRCRVEELLKRIETGPSSGERLRQTRALEVAEAIGTSEAKKVLETLAKGAPGALLTEGAKAALERMAKRPSYTP